MERSVWVANGRLILPSTHALGSKGTQPVDRGSRQRRRWKKKREGGNEGGDERRKEKKKRSTRVMYTNHAKLRKAEYIHNHHPSLSPLASSVLLVDGCSVYCMSRVGDTGEGKYQYLHFHTANLVLSTSRHLSSLLSVSSSSGTHLTIAFSRPPPSRFCCY